MSERWGLYVYTYGGDQKAVVRFDVDAASEPAPASHQTGLRLIAFVPPPQVQPNGLPAGEMLQPLQALEDRLGAAVAAPEHRLVGIMTYGGMRDFVFQTDAPADLRAALDAIATPFRTEIRQSEGWDFFDRKIRPDDYGWQFVRNLQVIEQLRQAGSRLDAPHPVEHHFVGPAEALAHLRKELEADRFRCTGESSATAITLTREAPLEPESLSKPTTSLGRFAQSLGARYDGWGTMVVR